MTDPSALSVVGGTILFAAFVLTIHAATTWVRRHKTPAPTRPAAQQPRVGAGTTCTTTGCSYPGTVTVIEAPDLGGSLRRVCVGCANEGEAYQWWEYVG